MSSMSFLSCNQRNHKHLTLTSGLTSSSLHPPLIERALFPSCQLSKRKHRYLGHIREHLVSEVSAFRVAELKRFNDSLKCIDVIAARRREIKP